MINRQTDTIYETNSSGKIQQRKFGVGVPSFDKPCTECGLHMQEHLAYVCPQDIDAQQTETPITRLEAVNKMKEILTRFTHDDRLDLYRWLNTTMGCRMPY